MKLLNKLAFSALALPTIVVPTLSLTNCNKTISLKFEVQEKTEFHSIKLVGETQTLLDNGFNFGDSLNVYGPNDFKLEDIPLFTGYYSKNGNWQICCYSKGPEILLSTCGRECWEKSGLKNGDTITVELNQKAKYLDIETNLSITVKPDKSEFMTDEDWTNFHDIASLDPITNPIKQGLIYRGFSPLCVSNPEMYSTRSVTVNQLATKASIGYDIDISKTQEKVQEILEPLGTEFTWIKDKFANGNMTCLQMHINPTNPLFQQQTKTVMETLITQLQVGKKIYIHCVEGKDRTGFIFMILEGLAGCDERTIVKDFMQTFVSLFDVPFNSQQYKYVKQAYYDNFKGDLIEMCGEGKTMQELSVAYLIDKCGMTEQQLNTLKTLICK